MPQLPSPITIESRAYIFIFLVKWRLWSSFWGYNTFKGHIFYALAWSFLSPLLRRFYWSGKVMVKDWRKKVLNATADDVQTVTKPAPHHPVSHSGCKTPFRCHLQRLAWSEKVISQCVSGGCHLYLAYQGKSVTAMDAHSRFHEVFHEASRLCPVQIWRPNPIDFCVLRPRWVGSPSQEHFICLLKNQFPNPSCVFLYNL